MEDFDYIDALAKSELSGRTVSPSKDGWETVQNMLKRKKKKRRLLLFLLFFVMVSSFGIYQGVNFNSDNNKDNSIVNKNIEETKSGNVNSSNSNNNTDTNAVSSSDSDSSSTSNSQNDTSQAGTNTAGTNTGTLGNNNRQTGNSLKGNQNGVANTEAKIKSSLNDKKRGKTYKTDATSQNDQQNNTSNSTIIDENIEISAEAEKLKLYAWELITPEKLKKKRKKQTPKKEPDFYENLDIMVGLNGFFTPNDYQLSKSYVVEVSYTEEKKLKNNYYFNYGAALQFRNLHLKREYVNFISGSVSPDPLESIEFYDHVSSNKGELSINLFSSIEKRFGNFGIETGAYIGYEFYSPNNELFNNIGANFFEQKINYGLATSLNYKKIGLVFKYEFSPYIDYLGNKNFGGFTIGVKYDF